MNSQTIPPTPFAWRPFALRVGRRFVEENFDQLSASLAFTTLLSLVPLIAVVLSVVAAVPVFPRLVEQLDLYLARSLLPERSAGMIVQYLLEFSAKAGHVTLVGSLVLITTVALLLSTIERAFNHVWRVTSHRPWRRRFALYAALVALWPLLVGGIIVATSYAVTTSLGLIDEPPWLRRLLLRGLGLLIAGIFLGGLYYALPNTRVALRDAAGAGLFAAVAFLLMQKAFELYLASFPSYTAVYGTFATLPVFLLWLYLSWAVVLLGALVAATLPEFRYPAGDSGATRAPERPPPAR